MDNLENPPSAQTEITELRAQCASLRQMLGGLLVLVLVISGTINIYLWRQFRMTRAELRILRPQVGQLVADYQRVSLPAITEFLKSLNDYERTHPDFTHILVKYNLKAAGITGAAPANLPAAKK
ncbi:MAG TPA: hypothetical protein VHI52_15900 [Verrucomicrobiae bacterium]|jgi:hypothetical protein|nr:hypothetical protein [Verrucomicrobiae bacterium]